MRRATCTRVTKNQIEILRILQETCGGGFRYDTDVINRTYRWQKWVGYTNIRLLEVRIFAAQQRLTIILNMSLYFSCFLWSGEWLRACLVKASSDSMLCNWCACQSQKLPLTAVMVPNWRTIDPVHSLFLSRQVCNMAVAIAILPLKSVTERARFWYYWACSCCLLSICNLRRKAGRDSVCMHICEQDEVSNVIKAVVCKKVRMPVLLVHFTVYSADKVPESAHFCN